MRYLSEDGKVFNTKEECKEHENKIKNNEKEKRWEEVKKAKENYIKLLAAYCSEFEPIKIDDVLSFNLF